MAVIRGKFRGKFWSKILSKRSKYCPDGQNVIPKIDIKKPYKPQKAINRALRYGAD